MSQDLLDSALLLYDQSIEKDKTYFLPHIGKTTIYSRKKDLNKALEEAKQAIKKNPDYAEGFQAVGIIADAKGDTEEAEKYYRESIKKFDEAIKRSNDSNIVQANRFNKIVTLILLEETQKAEAEIELLKKENPDYGLLDPIRTLSRDSILFHFLNP